MFRDIMDFHIDHDCFPEDFSQSAKGELLSISYMLQVSIWAFKDANHIWHRKIILKERDG